MLSELIDVIDSRGRTLTPCRRKVAEREVRLDRAKWIGPRKIRLRFDPFAYRYIRLKVLERDNNTCYWCGQPGTTIDHVIPWSKGGRTTMDNCICACTECNGMRGDMHADDFARQRRVAPPRLSGGRPVGLPVPLAPVAAVAVETAAALELPKPRPRPEAVPVAETEPEVLPMAVGERSYAMHDLLDPYRAAVGRRW